MSNRIRNFDETDECPTLIPKVGSESKAVNADTAEVQSKFFEEGDINYSVAEWPLESKSLPRGLTVADFYTIVKDLKVPCHLSIYIKVKDQWHQLDMDEDDGESNFESTFGPDFDFEKEFAEYLKNEPQHEEDDSNINDDDDDDDDDENDMEEDNDNDDDDDDDEMGPPPYDIDDTVSELSIGVWVVNNGAQDVKYIELLEKEDLKNAWDHIDTILRSHEIILEPVIDVEDAASNGLWVSQKTAIDQTLKFYVRPKNHCGSRTPAAVLDSLLSLGFELEDDGEFALSFKTVDNNTVTESYPIFAKLCNGCTPVQIDQIDKSVGIEFTVLLHGHPFPTKLIDILKEICTYLEKRLLSPLKMLFGSQEGLIDGEFWRTLAKHASEFEAVLYLCNIIPGSSDIPKLF